MQGQVERILLLPDFFRKSGFFRPWKFFFEFGGVTVNCHALWGLSVKVPPISMEAALRNEDLKLDADSAKESRPDTPIFHEGAPKGPT